MEWKVEYDGYDLSKYCYILSVSTSLNAPRSNVFREKNNRYGSDYMSTRLGRIIVTINAVIREDVMENRDMLNRILFTREPKRLIINDQPERYLLAIPSGETKLTSRLRNSKVSITFESADAFWRSVEGRQQSSFTNGRAIVNNSGNAPTPPVIDLSFSKDCGFLSVVSPNGVISLGNITETDGLNLKPSEAALNEEMTNLSGWNRTTNASALIPDYKAISSSGTAKTDAYGISINNSSLARANDKWNGHAYMKDFAMGQIEREADIFRLRSRVLMSNINNRRATSAMLIVVMDQHNNPIMTTSVYDASSDRNGLVVTFKIPDRNNPKHSRIIHTGNLDVLSGFIEMQKNGDSLTWIVHTDKTYTGVSEIKRLRVGDTVKLKETATHAQTGHAFRRDYKHKLYRIGAIKVVNGQNVYRFDITGIPIYWVWEKDVQPQTVSMGQRLTNRERQVRYTMRDSYVGALRPYKVFVWQGVWGNTPIYEDFNLNSVVVDRHYSTRYRDLKNTFSAGDRLQINNASGEILLNGRPFDGLIDYDSKFFMVDGGETELGLYVSDWATMPSGTASWESRWL